jgi:hypothetical protein
MKDFIKIGRSKDPNTRLEQIQTGNPEELEMWEIHGVEEGEMHTLFRSLRIKEKGYGNEWFRRKGNLRDYIDGYKNITRDVRGKLTIVKATKRPRKCKQRAITALSAKDLIERITK